jgi:hypothetical protein
VATIVETIVAFLKGIGLEIEERELSDETRLPGLTIDGGKILYDPARLLYPGDLLHEAGHVAFTPAGDRPGLSGDSNFDLGGDIAAIAWSYAALMHLQLEPSVVFHDHGYQGSSRAFIENFAAGRYVGVPLLQWAGMTFEPKPGEERPVAYPAMVRWLRE